MTEYVLAYAKNIKSLELFGEAAYSEKWQPLAKKTNREKELRFADGSLETTLPDGAYEAGMRGKGQSALTFDAGFVVTQGRCTQVTVRGPFVWVQATLDEELKLGTRVALSKKFGLNALRHDQDERVKRPSSLINADVGAGTNEDGFDELTEIFGDERIFSYPKPSSLISYLVRTATLNDRGAVVLDFFAGSGTTAHAVAKLNAEDGGTRKFILVSSTEATIEAPDKNLCRDVCAQRVRRVLGGYTNAKGEAVEGLGGGFAYLRARRIPKHRLSLKLDHPEIWNALQLLHGHSLTPWAGGGFAVDERDGGAVAYVADAYPATRARLQEWLTQRGTQAATVYSWAPERYRTADSPHDWRPIPQHLRERFGR